MGVGWGGSVPSGLLRVRDPCVVRLGRHSLRSELHQPQSEVAMSMQWDGS